MDLEIENDNNGAFISSELLQLYQQYNVLFSTSSPYYPQANGIFESTNLNPNYNYEVYH